MAQLKQAKVWLITATFDDESRGQRIVSILLVLIGSQILQTC